MISNRGSIDISKGSQPARASAFRLASICALFATVFSLTSCNYFLGNKADSEQSFEKTGNSTCVKDVGANVKHWMEEGEGDIGASVDCAVLAIDEFTHHVVGQADGIYTRAELANFFRTYLAEAGSPLANDADGWTHEAMTMKQLAFGGGSGSISKGEVARIRAFLLRAKPVLASLTPHVRTMFFKNAKVMPEDTTESVAAIDKITNFISEEFSASVAERPTTSVHAVLSSARRLGVDSSSLDKWIPIASAVKAIVVGGEREKIRAEEWTPMLQAAGRVWALSLQYKYNIHHNEEWLGENFSETEEVLTGFLSLFETGVANHPNGIPISDWEAAIAAFAEKGYLPEGLTAPTVKRFLPLVFGKLLYGNSKRDRQSKSIVFGPEQLATLKDVLRDWIFGQRIVIATFGRSPSLDHSSLLRELSSETALVNAGISKADTPLALKTRNDLLSFYKEGRPLAHDSARRLVVVPRKNTPTLSRYDLDKLNLLRMIVKTVLKGWAHDAKAARDAEGLLEEETQEVYLDVKDIGAELGFMDVRNNEAGIRTFMEGGIFTSVSDGSDRMSVREGVEWFHFVMAGGGVADVIHERMVKDGCGLSTVDILGKVQLDTNCFREKFILNFAEFFPNLPNLVRWVREDRAGDRARAVVRALEEAGRTKGSTSLPTEATELRSMIPILHYAESLFARHDASRNDILDHDEVWGAFPILQPFIKKMGEGKADGTKMQKAIFSYLLKYGEPPAPTLMDTGKLIGWRLVHGFFKDSADRLEVLKVMGSFGKASKQSRIRDIGKFMKKHKGNLREVLAARATSTEKQLAEMFQCHPDAADLVGETFGRNAKYMVEGGSDVDQFVERGQLAIASEPRLTMKCLPF